MTTDKEILEAFQEVPDSVRPLWEKLRDSRLIDMDVLGDFQFVDHKGDMLSFYVSEDAALVEPDDVLLSMDETDLDDEEDSDDPVKTTWAEAWEVKGNRTVALNVAGFTKLAEAILAGTITFVKPTAQ